MEGKENFIYAVKVGRNPGIYYTKEAMVEQVRQFQGAVVGKFRELEKATKYMNSPLKQARSTLSKEEKQIIKERNRARKIQMHKKMKLHLDGDIICFIDCEADKNIAISLGAVVIDNRTNNVLSTFYSTIKPSNFVALDKFTKKLTGLTDEEINNSLSFDEVYKDFSAFVAKYEVSDIFSWSNNDKKFLQKSSQKNTKLISSIKNIQTIISMITADIIYNSCWSLKNIKAFLGIPSEVVHNALADALDLTNVYVKWKNKELDVDTVTAYNNDLLREKEAVNGTNKVERVS